MREASGDSEYPAAQVQAVGALAALGRTDLAILATMRWGSILPWSVIDLFAERRPTELDLKQVLGTIAKTDLLPDPNAVFALGLGRRAADVTAILDILGRAPRDSDLALACLLALQINGDAGAATVRAFLDHIRWPHTEYICALGLLRLRSPEAFAVLKSRLDRLGGPMLSASDTAIFIAVHLLEMKEVRMEVAAKLWQTLDRHRILFVAQGNLAPFAELGLDEVDNWLWDLALETGGYQEFGSQMGAIRALAPRFPDKSFDAALRLLELGSSGREDALELLLEIGREQAIPRLHGVVRDDESMVMLMVLGENLQAANLQAQLIGWLHDPEARVREGACVAAEAFAWSDTLAAALQEHLYDPDWDVRNAANAALDRLWHAREVDRLVDALLAESDMTRRWCLLNVALGAGYPGLRRRQPWVMKLFEGSLPLIMRQRISSRLAKRSKEVRSAIEKRERPSAS
jgi:hypothetical protein